MIQNRSKTFVYTRDVNETKGFVHAERVKLDRLTPIVRTAAIEDVNFVIDSWASSYRQSPVVHEVDPVVFKVEQRALIFDLLATCKLTAAYNPANPKELLGWICHTRDTRTGYPTVHYMYVKKNTGGSDTYRNRGVGTALMRATGWKPGETVWVTHWQPCVRKLRHKFDWFYNPYILRLPLQRPK